MPDKSVNSIVGNDANKIYPDSKVHGTNMGPIWGRQDPGGPMNFAIWIYISHYRNCYEV